MALFVSPFAQYTDASGNPGSGYKLYFYQTATTTPITIYSDSAFLTPTANPAIADSAGQWAAIYVNTGSYKVVMKSAADVTIRTADPVSGAPVSGPTSSTDNAVARFDGVTGKLLQDSLVIIGDTGNVTGVVNFTATGNIAGVAGIFSGAVSGTTGTFTGAVSGTTGTFTGVVSASNGTAAAPGFKLASSQVGLYRTTSDGGIGFTTAGVSKGAFHSTGFTVALGSGPDQLIDPDGTVVGASMSTVGQIGNYVSNNVCMFLGRSNSGSLVDFHTAGATKGTISEAAGTVTYGAFCGAHWSQFDDGERHELLPGTILETIDAMCEWPHDGKDNPNLTLPKIRVSATEASRRVYGVFSHWDDDDKANIADMHVAALGAKFVRIAKGVTVAGGDLLESNGDGCARVQSDEVFRSSTVAKVIASVTVGTYADGSYLVPCTLHAG